MYRNSDRPPGDHGSDMLGGGAHAFLIDAGQIQAIDQQLPLSSSGETRSLVDSRHSGGVGEVV